MRFDLISSVVAWIPWWGWFDIVFTGLVLLGICGESKKLSVFLAQCLVPKGILGFRMLVERKAETVRLWSERLLILGVAGEIICVAFSLYDSASLNKEAAQLRLKLMPRRIVMEQVTNFMVLSDGFPKIPIKIVINQDSAEQYAHDIRQMFDCANFPKPPDADTWGISRNMEYRITLKFKYTNDAPDVFFVTYGTNDVFNILNHVQVSGRYIFPDTNQMTVYSAIKDCFKKIGINSVWHSSDFLVKTGECCILVLPKQF